MRRLRSFSSDFLQLPEAELQAEELPAEELPAVNKTQHGARDVPRPAIFCEEDKKWNGMNWLPSWN